MSAIRILNGVYRNQPVKGATFELVKGFQTGAKGGYVTVKSNGYFGAEFDVVRVRVDSIRDLEYTNGMIQDNTVQLKKPVVTAETEDEAMNRIRERFDILHEMSKACVNGDIRAMIVSGPPGVGKSFGV
jgi:ATP-dependent Lon protease